jgi:DNA-binding LytR/AlgR family response regulator
MKKLKVALLEDNKIQLKQRKIILEENDLALVSIWSTDSTDFMEKVEQERPQALFLDIDLGNNSLSGIEVAHAIKLPVLFVSANNAHHLKDLEGIQREYDFPIDHITKPFSDSDFVKSAKRFLKEVIEYLESAYVILDFKESKRNKIPVSSIIYLESDTGDSGKSNNKRIYFSDRKPEILSNFSFSSMSKHGFDENTFIQTHKSYRINIQKFKCYNIDHTISMEVMNEKGKLETREIPVSENFQRTVKKML